jgi:hypothetical protein
MATLVARGSQAFAALTTYSPTLGAHISGDLLIVAFSIDGGTGVISPPAGWTAVPEQLTNIGTTSAHRMLVYVKIAASASETCSVTKTDTVADAVTFNWVYRGHGVSAPSTEVLVAAQQNSVAASTAAWPTLAGLTSSKAYVAVAMVGTSRGAGAPVAAPAGGWGNWARQNSVNTALGGQSLGVGEQALTGVSSVTAGSSTLTGSNTSITSILAFPDAAGVAHTGSFVATAVGSVAVSGVLGKSSSFIATGAGQVSVAGTLGRVGAFSASGVGAVDVTGSVGRSGAFAATGTGQVETAGQRGTSGSFAAVGTGQADVVGVLGTIGSFDASGVGEVETAGVLALTGAFGLAGVGAVDVSGDTFGPVIPPPDDPELTIAVPVRRLTVTPAHRALEVAPPILALTITPPARSLAVTVPAHELEIP